jgi:hypothetical protein
MDHGPRKFMWNSANWSMFSHTSKYVLLQQIYLAWLSCNSPYVLFDVLGNSDQFHRHKPNYINRECGTHAPGFWDSSTMSLCVQRAWITVCDNLRTYVPEVHVRQYYGLVLLCFQPRTTYTVGIRANSYYLHAYFSGTTWPFQPQGIQYYNLVGTYV